MAHFVRAMALALLAHASFAVGAVLNITSPYYKGGVTPGQVIALEPMWSPTDSLCCLQLALYAVGSSTPLSSSVSGLNTLATSVANCPGNGWAGGVPGNAGNCMSSYVWQIPATLPLGVYFVLTVPGSTGTVGGVSNPSAGPLPTGQRFNVVPPAFIVQQPSATSVVDGMATAAEALRTASGSAAAPSTTVVTWTGNVSQCLQSAETSVVNPVLSCPAGKVIASIDAVWYGTPFGGCPSSGLTFPVASRCSASNAAANLAALCNLRQGPSACTVPAGFNGMNSVFSDPCVGTYKRLVTFYTCATRVFKPTPEPPEAGPMTNAAVFASSDTLNVQFVTKSALSNVDVELRLDASPASSRALVAVLASSATPIASSAAGTFSIATTLPAQLPAFSNGPSWSFVTSPPAGATGLCVLRIKSSEFPTTVVNDSAPFYCFPPLSIAVTLNTSAPATLPVPTVFSGRTSLIRWTYGAGQPAALMGRPTVSLMLSLTPIVSGVAAPPVLVPYGVIVSPSQVAADIFNYSAPLVPYTSAPWTVPSAAALTAGCAAAAAALLPPAPVTGGSIGIVVSPSAPAVAWPAGASVSLAAAFSAACAPGPAAVWSVQVAMERRPAVPGVSARFAIANTEPLSILAPAAVLIAGSSYTFTWTAANVGALFVTASFPGSVIYSDYLPGSNPTTFTLNVPATRPAGAACDASGVPAPVPGTITFSSVLDPSLKTTVAFSVQFPVSSSIALTPSSGTLSAGSGPWMVSWKPCGVKPVQYAVSLQCLSTPGVVVLASSVNIYAVSSFTFTAPSVGLIACSNYGVVLTAADGSGSYASNYTWAGIPAASASAPGAMPGNPAFQLTTVPRSGALSFFPASSPYSAKFTAATSGTNFILFAFRHDPGYWDFVSPAVTAPGSTTNLLVNADLAGVVNTNKLTGWGLFFQNGVRPYAAGVIDTSSRQPAPPGASPVPPYHWVDGAVGSFDGFYQGLNLTAGVTYTVSFNVREFGSTGSDTKQIGIFTGACVNPAVSVGACVLPPPPFGFTSITKPNGESNSPTSTVTPSGTPSNTPSSSKTRSSSISMSSTPSQTPTGSITRSVSSSPTSSPSPTPYATVSFSSPGFGTTCPAGWTSGGVNSASQAPAFQASQRCYKAFGRGLSFNAAQLSCMAQGPTGSLASITQLSEFFTLQAMDAQFFGSDTWLGLYDSQAGLTTPSGAFTSSPPGFPGFPNFNGRGQHPCTANCRPNVRTGWWRSGGTAGAPWTPSTTRLSNTWKWASGASTDFLFSATGQSMWNSYEPNNWQADVNNGVGGEYAVGFLGSGLNDWNTERIFPYICEQRSTDYAPGDFIPSSWTGGFGAARVTLTGAAGITLGKSFVAAVNVTEPSGRGTGASSVRVYVPCTLPPGAYSVAVRDYSGASYSSPVFNIKKANLVVLAPTGSAVSITNGSTLALAWSPASDAVYGRPEFATISLSLTCGSSSVPLGQFATSTNGATIRPIAMSGLGCGTGPGANYRVVASPVGCDAGHGPFTFGPFAILPTPETLSISYPAQPTPPTLPTPFNWKFGNPFTLRFKFSGSPASSVTLRYAPSAASVGTVLKTLTPAELEAGAVDVNAASSATTPFTNSFVFQLVSSSGVSSVTQVITHASPLTGIVVSSTLSANNVPTIYSDEPLVVSWQGTSTCAVTLSLVSGGAVVTSASNPALTLAARSYSWTLPAGVYTTGASTANYHVVVSVAACGGVPSQTGNSPAFAASTAFGALSPAAGELVWAGSPLTVTWVASTRFASGVTITAITPGAPSVVVATGVSAAMGAYTWTPTAAQVATLTASQAYGVMQISVAATSSAGRSASAILPTSSSARFVLCASKPVLDIVAPSSNHSIEQGAAFPVKVVVGVLTSSVAAASEPVITVSNSEQSSIVLSSFAAMTAASPPKLVTMPISYAPYLNLSYDMELHYSGKPVQNLLKSAQLYEAGRDSPRVHSVIITNATLASKLFGEFFTARATLLSYGKAILTADSHQFGIVPFLFDVVITEPKAPAFSPGILYSESKYTITWSTPDAPDSGQRVNVHLIASEVQPGDGISTGWGVGAKAEIIVPGVLASACNATWSFSSVDRKWWGNSPEPILYWIALVTTDSSHRVIDAEGPFTLSRSALALAPAAGTPPVSLSAFYGSSVAVAVSAVGFAGVTSRLQLVVHNEPIAAFDNCQYWANAGFISAGASVVASAPSYTAPPNTALSPLSVTTLTWVVTVGNFPPSPPENFQTVMRVRDSVSGVFSCSAAIAGSVVATSRVAAAYELWGGWGTEPVNPATLLLSGVGSYAVSLAVPVVAVTITSSSVTSVGSTLAFNIAVSHTWLSNMTATISANLVPQGAAPIALTLTGCSPVFPVYASASHVTKQLACSAVIPALQVFNTSYQVVAREAGSGVTGSSINTVAIYRASLSWATATTTPALPFVTIPLGAPAQRLVFCYSGVPSSSQAWSLSLGLPGFAYTLAPNTYSVAQTTTSCTGSAGGGVLFNVDITAAATLPASIVGASGVTLTVVAVNAPHIQALTGLAVFVGDPYALQLTNVDPVGTTYSVKDILAGTKTISLTATAPAALAASLATQGAVSNIQLRCPGYAKAGWGWTNPYWAWESQWRHYRWGPRANWPTAGLTWNWWNPWYYRSHVWHWRCWRAGASTSDPRCSSTRVEEVRALFVDPASAKYEMIVQTVGRVSWASVPAGAATASQTVVLSIKENWSRISYYDGACYFRTNTTGPLLKPASGTDSGKALCASLTGPCAEFSEGEWNHVKDSYFKPLFAMAPPTRTFPLTVALPPQNSNGAYLVSGDVARVTADLSGLASPPSSVQLELRADGFRGNAMVGSSIVFPIGTAKNLRFGAIPLITPFTDNGDDGIEYANWGDANSEGTGFRFRLLDSNYVSSWTFADTTPFVFCPWPAISSVRMRRLYWGPMWLEGYTQLYDPLRPWSQWAPLAALGDPTTVDIRKYNVDDLMRVRAFGIECMSAVNFALAAYDAVAGTTTILQRLCQNIGVDPYDGTINCDFYLRRAFLLAPAGTAYVVVATGADGRGSKVSQFFAVSCPTCQVFAPAPSPSTTSTYTFTVSPTSSVSSTNSATSSGTSSTTSTRSASTTVSSSATPSGTPSTTKTGSTTVSASSTSTRSTSGSTTVSTTGTPSGTPTGTDTGTRTGTGSGTTTTTLTATGTPTPSSSRTPSATPTPIPSSSPSQTPSSSSTISASTTGTGTPSGTDTSTSTPTPSGTSTPTPTATGSGTTTTTLTATSTPSSTPSTTSSSSASSTPTPTSSASPTSSATPSSSSSPSPSNTPSSSNTASPTSTPTPTTTTSISATPSTSESSTNSASPTPSTTETATSSVSLEPSPSNTASPSYSSSASTSLSSTGTDTPSSSPSITSSPSNSATPSTTSTSTASASAPAMLSTPPNPQIVLTSPASSTTWMTTQPYTVSWTVPAGSLPDTVSLDLYQLTNAGGRASSQGQVQTLVLHLGTVSTLSRSLSGTLPAALTALPGLASPGVWGVNFYVLATSTTRPSRVSHGPSDGSFFAILAPAPPALISVVSPGYGAVWNPGSSQTVSWNVPGDGTELAAAVNDLNGDGSGSFIDVNIGTVTGGVFSPRFTLASQILCVEIAGGQSSVQVTVPTDIPLGDMYYIQLSFQTSPDVTALSYLFSMSVPSPPGLISATAPVAGATCSTGGMCVVAWTSSSVTTLSIALSSRVLGVAATVLGPVTVPAASGVYAFALPASFVPSVAPYWFELTSASDSTVTASTALFSIAAPAPPSAAPSISVSAPTSSDSWVVDRSAVGNNASGSFPVSWVSTGLPPLTTVAITLKYRAVAASTSSGIVPTEWSFASLASGVNASAGSVFVAIPAAVPVPAPGSTGAAAYVYSVIVTAEQDSTVASHSDLFAVLLTANSNPAPAPPAPVTSASPSSAAVPVGVSDSSTSSPAPSVAAISIAPTPSATPVPLQVNLQVTTPLANTVVYVTTTATVTYTLNASTAVEYLNSSITLIRKLASGDSIAVAVLKGTGAGTASNAVARRALQAAASLYDPTPLNASSSSWTWDVSPAATAGMLFTSGYALRVSFTTDRGTVVFADSGSFTLALLPTLTVTAPAVAAGEAFKSFSAGEAVGVTWTKSALDGNVKIEAIDFVSGAVIQPAIAAELPASLGSFTWNASTAWGAGVPLALKVSSLSRTDTFGVSAGIKVLPLPVFIQVTSALPSAPTLIIGGPGAPPTVDIKWTSQGIAGSAQVDLVCVPASNTGGPATVAASFGPVNVDAYAAAPLTLTMAAFSAPLTVASVCVLNVKSVASPLVFGASHPLSVVPTQQPSLTLITPAPSGTGTVTTTTVAVGDTMPLAWASTLVSGPLTMTLTPTGSASANAAPLTYVVADVTAGAVPGFTLPLSAPVGNYIVTFSAAPASGEGPKAVTAPYSLSVTAPDFVFSSPASGSIVAAGGELTVAWTTTSSALSVCSQPAAGISVDLFTLGIADGQPQFVATLIAGTQACAATGVEGQAFTIPATTLVGDYFVVARASVSAQLPSLAAASAHFRITPQAAASSIIVWAPPPAFANPMPAPVAGGVVTAGDTLGIWFNASGFALTSTFTFTLYQCPTAVWSVTCSSQQLATGIQNVAVWAWPVPALIGGTSAWDARLFSFVSVAWTGAVAPSAVGPSMGVSPYFRILPAPVNIIANVTMSPDPGAAGWLNAATTSSLRLFWTALAGSTTRYNVELWQERYYFNGGDVLLYTATAKSGPVAPLLGAVTYEWADLPTDLVSTAPVYIRVIAAEGPYVGVWGRTRTFNLLSAPLPGLADFLASECGSGDFEATGSGALCATNCGECESKGGVWATGSIVDLSYYIAPESPELELPIGTVELARLSSTLGAFVQSTPVCVPAAALDGSAVVASSSGVGTQLQLPLGNLASVQAALSALRPNGSVPILSANLTVNAAATAATCGEVQPIVAFVMALTVPASEAPNAAAMLTAALATATNIPATSFTVTLRSQVDASAASSRRLAEEGHAAARKLQRIVPGIP